MYQNTSPNALYTEYQARVAAAVRNHALAVESQEHHSRVTPRPVGALERAWMRLSAQWTRGYARLLRSIEPAEEGYIA